MSFLLEQQIRLHIYNNTRPLRSTGCPWWLISRLFISMPTLGENVHMVQNTTPTVCCLWIYFVTNIQLDYGRAILVGYGHIPVRFFVCETTCRASDLLLERANCTKMITTSTLPICNLRWSKLFQEEKNIIYLKYSSNYVHDGHTFIFKLTVEYHTHTLI